MEATPLGAPEDDDRELLGALAAHRRFETWLGRSERYELTRFVILRLFRLRPFRDSDVDALVHHGSNRAVWINMTNLFPHPYTLEDAKRWVVIAKREPENGLDLAIDVDGQVIGAVGFRRQTDLSTKTAEIGYWLGETFWGRGLAPKALQLATKFAFEHYDFERLQAGVIGWNPRSARVLEKSGYAFEGTHRRDIFKDGKVSDRLMYAKLRDA